MSTNRFWRKNKIQLPNTILGTMKRTILLLLLAIISGAIDARAQGAAVQAMSLKQSIEYALKNKASLRATRNGELTAKAQVGEIRAAGLPQINAAVELGSNFIQQKTALDTGSFV